MATTTQVYLASSSPRRRELLEQIGIRYSLLNVSVDEIRLATEQPADYVRRLALTKARAGWDSLGADPSRPVLGADTAVIVDGAVLGKPRDRTEGLAMLSRLSGREHQVLSGVALVMAEREAVRVQTSRVRWRALSAAECQAYWETGEPGDKAGGYGIQGRAAAFITELRGSYSGVMGLPLFETAELLGEFGIHVL
ncbi:MAG: septum formation inhibitor Maf [Gammaproteobacteria bacterium]|nr:septum formation inhibitor Maf [Gammaproteobacteria bacterium]MCP5423989.1 septum formation inhibitor Maf [Gammaproteobacteria bacterium]